MAIACLRHHRSGCVAMTRVAFSSSASSHNETANDCIGRAPYERPHRQWTGRSPHCSGLGTLEVPPFGGMIQTIVETTSGTLIAAAISGLYKSTDDGRTWIACRALPQQASGLTRRPALAMIGRDIYATGYGDDLVLVTDDTCDKYAEMRMLGAGGSSATRETALASTATGVLIVAREEGTVFSSPDGDATGINRSLGRTGHHGSR